MGFDAIVVGGGPAGSTVGGFKELTHPPVLRDSSHATGRRSPGGLVVEGHPEPELASSDGPQSLTLEGFEEVMGGPRRVAEAVGRTI